MMQKEDDMNIFRDKLRQAECQAPDFDTLFREDILENASLRSICRQKFAHRTEKAPSFETLFGQEPIGKSTLNSPKRNWYLWSISTIAAAACLTLMLLLPNPKNSQTDYRTQNKTIEEKQTATHSQKPLCTPSQKALYTQKIPASQTIKTLTINHKKAIISAIQEIGLTETTTRDTSDAETLKPIAPTGKGNLSVHRNRSLEEAYAEAKTAKIKAKRRKPIIGANINGGNRLLSMANSNSSEFGLSSVTNSYADGFNQLEGTTSLRTATSSKNEWAAPENIEASALLNGEDKYYLPINLCLSFSLPLGQHVDLITGLNYAYIGSKTTGSNTTGTFELKRGLHYLGIPLKVSVSFLKSGAFETYIGAGGMIEKGLIGVQNSTHTNSNGEKDTWNGSQKIYGVQTSVNGLLGVSYELNNIFRLYVEPGVAYYIPSDQPVCSRTEEPFNFNLSLGVRYCLQ
jgi:hypothetical protein